RMFMEPSMQNSAHYKTFWETLIAGGSTAGHYKFLDKSGKREIWIQTSYTPIMDHHGRVRQIMMYGVDITEQKLINIDYQGQIEGINASQGVIQFHIDGTILEANQHFLKATGYALSDIKGQHHSMFMRVEARQKPEYAQFWQALRQGQAQ